MSSRKLFGVAAVLVALALVMASPAAAGQGWPWPVEGARVLPFGATYRASDGSTNVHSGLDISAAAGDRVRTCAAGEVVFAGKVPAGEGAQAFAVTVLTADGLRVSLLPLSSVSVSSGSRVSAGDPIGVLAATGDASGAATHLHLGVKRGSIRLDPGSFLADGAPAPASPKPAASEAPAAAPHRTGAPAAARPSAAPAAVPAPGSAAVPALAPGAPVVDAHASADQTVRSTIEGLSRALAGTPRLRRIPTVKTVRMLSVTRVWRDVTDLSGALGRTALAAVLAAVSAGCAIAVIRSAGQHVAEAGAALAPVREERS
jgi:hypothetical protein